MRILQVITNTDRRGAQVFASDLEKALRLREHVVETRALTRGKSQHLLVVPTLGPAQRSTRGILRLHRLMSGFDVVVAHGSTTGFVSALAAIGASTPWVYRQISDSRFWAPTRARRTGVHFILRRADLIVALSTHAYEDLVTYIGIPADRIRIVPNGVPSAGFPLSDPSSRPAARSDIGLADLPTVLYAGALVPEKGVDVAIEAAARLPGIQLLVVGDGPERGRLEALGQRVAPNRVVFAGTLARPQAAYAAADAVVLPSRGGDSMPAVLVEAGYSGLPTVATPIGSIEEIVSDGVTGVIVPPDDPAGLSEGIERALASGVVLGAAARRYCLGRFDIDVVAARWEEVLQEAAGRSSGTVPH
jgi:glycosyltransferase involved in cell wall biosynthesis